MTGGQVVPPMRPRPASFRSDIDSAPTEGRCEALAPHEHHIQPTSVACTWSTSPSYTYPLEYHIRAGNAALRRHSRREADTPIGYVAWRDGPEKG